MHGLECDEGSEQFLMEELGRAFPNIHSHLVAPGLLCSDFTFPAESPPLLAFCRQFLPAAEECRAKTISAWSKFLFETIRSRFPENQPWMLHVTPKFSVGRAGQNRCRLILDALDERLARHHRQLRRQWQRRPAPFSPQHSIAQLLLLEPERGLLSIAPSPVPHQLRGLIWPFPNGVLPQARDLAAPCRAFAKLIEAETRMSRSIAANETCVDLGASPGSWSYVALQRGANVTAVDRAPLRDDLMRHPRLKFQKGNAFSFKPSAQVDWLLCDVIAAPERSIGLLLDWAKNKRARRFIVTIKFKGHADYCKLETLKQAMPPLCAEFYLTRLCANKNEVCAFGEIKA